jgi:lipopolysaccharide transport system permease protein
MTDSATLPSEPQTLRPPEDGGRAEQPLVTIARSPKWVALDLRDLWGYRELLVFLTWRDIKVRYKQTALGAAWAVIQPFFMMVVFTLFFGKLAGVASNGVPYPVFSYAGLLPWTFFQNAVTNSGNSLVGNSNLLTKVYFPRLIIPSAAVAAGLVDFGIAFVVLLGLMAYYGIPLSVGMLLIPALVLLTTMIALAVGLWMSAQNVKYRDIRYALPFVLQLWMFATPVIYPTDLVPERWRWVMAFNPLVGIIDCFRAALFGGAFDSRNLAISFGVTTVALIYAAYSFRRMEKTFADIV